MSWHLKESGPIASEVVQTFGDFGIFLITPGEFYSWKMYCMEDMNENVTSYGNHNKAYTIEVLLMT